MVNRTVSSASSASDLARRIPATTYLADRLRDIVDRFKNGRDTHRKLALITLQEAADRRLSALEERIRDAEPRSFEDVVAQLISLTDTIEMIFEPPVAGHPKEFRGTVSRRLHRIIHFIAGRWDIDVREIGGDSYLRLDFSPEYLADQKRKVA
jgi:hypothetical protein